MFVRFLVLCVMRVLCWLLLSVFVPFFSVCFADFVSCVFVCVCLLQVLFGVVLCMSVLFVGVLFVLIVCCLGLPFCYCDQLLLICV